MRTNGIFKYAKVKMWCCRLLYHKAKQIISKVTNLKWGSSFQMTLERETDLFSVDWVDIHGKMLQHSYET